jgi:hydrogenase expression/formation protein HypD
VTYSIADAVTLAEAEPGREVVFFAVGFETTACTTAAAVARGLPENLSILSSHRLVPPALSALLSSERLAIDAFLLPGHVSTVIGLEGYGDAPGAPMVVAGFDAVDILAGLDALLRQLADGERTIENAYARAVKPAGNLEARRLIANVFEPVDAAWRGIGTIPGSGLALREAHASHDARVRFGAAPDPEISDTEPGCLCGDVLLGAAAPEDCPLFGKACHPDRPVGACMVAYEGTCHARYRLRGGAR